MFVSRELKYILLTSVSALVISAVLGLFCGLSFFTILIRSFLQFIFFLVIGLLIEFIYKKYLSNLFSTELSGDIENKLQDDKKSVKDFKENLDFQNKNSLYENSQNNSSSVDFIEEVKKYKFDTEDMGRGSDKNKKISFIEENDPKVVADAIKTLMSKKE
ncbi:hypothetical protein QIA17_01865 [Borreliella californiensis]|uniref:Flagellar biosynthesis/type III secretory pathway M-ring protein FliF/YscJ n=1 Tax=Borreliella californiensis TaxID=373543 RepID=A0A7W9ZKE4_9SPIR|nr:hypothetical protein [Borreliella californiensis]MBB6213101.1 flagellar biosynthesis/type III secretory pathway M-ring protein FliF/YscJ [Borreliella californiensis]WKC91568.1 hypothetical protein QIA17_01865 [Borreliella californiensis]WNY70324.1 hypothetical protein QIA39_01330 [Borreliella californiensis]